LAATYLDICGDNWLAEDAEIDFLLPETQADTTLHVCGCRSQHGKRDCSNCRNDGNRTGRHWVRVAKHTVLPSFVFIRKFLRDLQLLIRDLFRVIRNVLFSLGEEFIS
jgi:hypothetical protein